MFYLDYIIRYIIICHGYFFNFQSYLTFTVSVDYIIYWLCLIITQPDLLYHITAPDKTVLLYIKHKMYFTIHQINCTIIITNTHLYIIITVWILYYSYLQLSSKSIEYFMSIIHHKKVILLIKFMLSFNDNINFINKKLFCDE